MRDGVFGPRDQLIKLKRSHANEYHFERLAHHAHLVKSLGLHEEMYLSPLSDLEEFQRQLHRDSTVGRVIQV
ncbi:MAG: hypothetical protein SGPRY_011291 [Prymnesium sp.]